MNTTKRRSTRLCACVLGATWDEHQESSILRPSVDEKEDGIFDSDIHGPRRKEHKHTTKRTQAHTTNESNLLRSTESMASPSQEAPFSIFEDVLSASSCDKIINKIQEIISELPFPINFPLGENPIEFGFGLEAYELPEHELEKLNQLEKIINHEGIWIFRGWVNSSQAWHTDEIVDKGTIIIALNDCDGKILFQDDKGKIYKHKRKMGCATYHAADVLHCVEPFDERVTLSYY